MNIQLCLNPEKIHHLKTISKVYLYKTLLLILFFSNSKLEHTVILLRIFIEVFLNNLVCWVSMQFIKKLQYSFI